VQRRDPILGLGGLATLLGLLVFGWIVRQPPAPADCAPTGPNPVRDAWLVGLAPAAFVTACSCAGLALWASAAVGGRERPHGLSIVLAVVVPTLGLGWWTGGEGSWVNPWMPVVALGLLAAPIIVPGLISGIWWFRRKRSDDWAWRSLQLLAWWSALVFIPGFVALVSLWAEDFYC
jgi:hypothetical protein